MKADEQLLAELERATEGLLFLSESDYPFELVSWGRLNEISFDYLRRQAAVEASAPVQVQSLEEFFGVAMSEAQGKGERALAIARRFQSLVRLLKENLTELKVYRIGEINVPVYIVGRTRAGNWVGLSTRVVET
jgi:hypothetical protein